MPSSQAMLELNWNTTSATTLADVTHVTEAEIREHCDHNCTSDLHVAALCPGDSYLTPETTLRLSTIGMCIRNIKILSNARHVEVYAGDEYIGTGSNVHSVDLNTAWICHSLNPDEHLPPKAYTVKGGKFILPKNERQELRVYRIEIQQSTALALSSTKRSTDDYASNAFDMSQVRKMLGSLDVPISSAAMRLLEDVENQQSSSQQAGNPLLAMMMAGSVRLPSVSAAVREVQGRQQTAQNGSGSVLPLTGYVWYSKSLYADAMSLTALGL
ncbi:hypothetical protein DFJ77DRAFT_277739 [Powellomyces hirtus]|nr:hypothetical protein DFJ77DRAFT_277739 [Powellomyces hirtus]